MHIDSTVQGDDFVEVKSGSLLVLSADSVTAVGKPVPIGVEPCVVGRGSHCHVVLDDPRVSTSHCEFVATDKGVLVTDLDAKNGTYVNQVLLQKRGSVCLTLDARIRCGQTWLAFRHADSKQVPIWTAASFGLLVGHSIEMRRLYARLAKAASHELSVLVTGETGTGKELVAKAIHHASARRDGPFVTVDCTTIPASLAESHLFGHEKGSFTGAVSRNVSPFIAAQRGTLFFDELGELPSEMQPKLLRVLEAREIQSVGSSRYQPIDVRVIAATRRNIHAELNAHRFRDDLYYRFAQVLVDVPPLRARTEDIPDLVARFLANLGDRDALGRIAEAAMDRLRRHDWPGNVRELRNVVLAAHAQSAGGPIDFSEFMGARENGFDLSHGVSALRSFHVLKREMLDAFEREYFGKLYAETEGNVSEISRRSGLSRPMVREYLERHGLRASDD
jgi:DNA-binding NtrC family response regulator